MLKQLDYSLLISMRDSDRNLELRIKLLCTISVAWSSVLSQNRVYSCLCTCAKGPASSFRLSSRTVERNLLLDICDAQCWRIHRENQSVINYYFL